MSDYFELKNNGTDARREILAGVTTFVSIMYVIVVNPAILKATGMACDASLTATVLVSAAGSILMGLYTNSPLVVAPGMGLNLLLVYGMTHSEGMDHSIALGCVFYTGVAYFLLLVLDRRRRLITGIPRMLRFGFAGGIGLFVAQLGLEAGGFVVYRDGITSLGVFDVHFLTFLAGLAITSTLVARKMPGSFLLGVAATALLAIPIGRVWGEGAVPVVVWSGLIQPPEFDLFLHLDLVGAAKFAHLPFLFVLAFSCLFDSLATCVGVSEAGDLVDEHGEPRHLDRCLRVSAVSVALAGLLGTSPATPYIESCTGIRVGGRTGLTAVVAGLLFLPFLFLSPLLTLVPALATAPILVLAGVFMLKPLIYVRWERFDDAVPFFMAMIIMPLTHSITQGIIWGCLSFTVLKVACGKYRQITPILIALDVVAVVLLYHSEYISG